MITTAVILARGLGTRMRADGGQALNEKQLAAAQSGHKALMPLGSHRLVDYSMNAMADAGITHVVLVVPPDHVEFRDHFAAVSPSRLRVSYAVQAEPQGTADAVASAEDAVEGEPFLMANGDNLYPTGAIERLRTAQCATIMGFERSALIEHSNIPSERIAAFALVKHRDGVLADIVEKPSPEQVEKAGADALVSMNLCAFTPEIFAACRAIQPSARGELEIVDALRELPRVEVRRYAGGVLDLSRRDDIADVERRLAGTEVVL